MTTDKRLSYLFRYKEEKKKEESADRQPQKAKASGEEKKDG